MMISHKTKQQKKECMCMFKKVGIATALSATVLFGGAFVSDVEASAN